MPLPVTLTTPWVDASKRLQLINTLAAGIVVSHWSAVLTVAIAGVIVAILKGPRASGPLPEGSASRRGGGRRGPLARRDIGACRAASLALSVLFPAAS